MSIQLESYPSQRCSHDARAQIVHLQSVGATQIHRYSRWCIDNELTGRLIGEGGQRAEMEGLAKTLGLGDRILFPGYAPDPAAALAALDVFTLSSSTEQTSNSLLEAMACGLPAVVTDVGDSRVVLGEDASSVVVPSGDEGAYAAALVAMARSPELRREWGQRNRRRCLAEYPQDRMIREYQALYYAAYTSR